MSNKLNNFILGQWMPHEGSGFLQYNAITGDPIYSCGSDGINYAALMKYARQIGGPNLRKMTFQQRGLMLKKLALHLHNIRKKYYPISYLTGATKGDTWIDVDGGIGTLFAYASLRRKFPDLPYYIDGEPANLSKEGTFIGQHIMVPKHGVAIHINAFNFPVWGMLEKLAVNLLAGVPAIVKPSEITSFLAEAVVRDIIQSGILPDGALQLICGKGHGILDGVCAQDIVTFTGSASTGRMLKNHPAIAENAVPFNMEADSLNAAILGQDAAPGTAVFDLFIREVRKEITVKCGQKCTAIRRIIVPEQWIEEVQLALSQELQKITIGNPELEEVRMGALVSKAQQEKVLQQVELLKKASTLVYEHPNGIDVLGADPEKGAFMTPMLFLNEDPFNKLESHQVEAFGPVGTIMPYRDLDEAIALANLGKGSLVSTIATADEHAARHYVLNAAAFHGRILMLNEASAKESTGHGSPMPMLVHGGPGRAGGGEEMGGMRGVMHYLQRTAVQGHPSMLTAVTGTFLPGSAYKETEIHPFRKHFEDLQIGETHTTAKHTVTETDIVNFANLSGDHFYAHVDVTALDGTIFEQRVAHGYYILSKAAGLFVDARKGPVLLNYGIDEFRFTKPVYPGTTIGVRLTVKEKISQEKREENDIKKGIVKWLVEVYDQVGETVARGVILTMVRCREDS
ncbi:MAG TPA: phenylacetic acid degradation bifunctional protein PaaZ [Saprospiraceae bacterium]|nr:phenylacetic acid degradation bifunctional protein PaaZ [Saprospiraceae bacterium]HMQ83857.1 phenylacetic acid degradation bifunctional protein PaaZ [Saprospiraceae bacterium]